MAIAHPKAFNLNPRSKNLIKMKVINSITFSLSDIKINFTVVKSTIFFILSSYGV